MLRKLIDQFNPDPQTLAGKTVLITGAAGALGSSVAKKTAAAGGELVLLDKNERALNQLYDDILAHTGVRAGLYPLDLAGASTTDYNELATTIDNEFGALHGLTHCAAEIGQLTPFTQTDATTWQKNFACNLHGPVFLTIALLPLLRRSDSTSIIFTIDDRQNAYWGSYAASKAAITNVAITLADELDGDRNDNGTLKVRCNAINPVKLQSALRSSAYPGEDRFTLPKADCKTDAFIFLLCDQSLQINGQVLTLSERETE